MFFCYYVCCVIVAIRPTSEVGGVRLTWDKENSVLVEWDHVITDDITGYKLHWSSQLISNKEIAAITAVNNTIARFLLEHTNKLLMDATELYVYIWTYNLAGDGPVTYSCKLKFVVNMPYSSVSNQLSAYRLPYLVTPERNIAQQWNLNQK